MLAVLRRCRAEWLMNLLNQMHLFHSIIIERGTIGLNRVRHWIHLQMSRLLKP